MEAAKRNPFVHANESIIAKARELGYDAPVPLLCECPDANCRGFVRTLLEDFDAARTPPWQAITLPGHDYSDSALTGRLQLSPPK